MIDTGTYKKALGKLRGLLTSCQKDDAAYLKMVEARDVVLGQFQKTFSEENLPALTEEEFHSFLTDNQHWSGLYRQLPKLCSDMPKLRKALKLMLYGDGPIENRLDKSVKMVDGMGKAIATAVLLIVFPDEFGVWNNTTEEGLMAVELWPDFDRGESFGSKYLKVNGVLQSLSKDLGVDLWELDSLLWRVKVKARGVEEETLDAEELEELEQKFGLEKYLHEFLRDNWKNTDLGKDWEIYSEPGEDEKGYKYNCEVGEIDILAKHRKKPEWLVIELKRWQSGDDTVGQVLRYMGWVMEHMAEPGEKVKGLVIAHEADKKLKYALVPVPEVDFKLYDVKFNLKEGDE